MNGTVNKVILVGHLGDEVKMHYFDGGNCIGRFPLATNEVYINKSTGEKINSTEWHNIVVRNKAAEICEKYLVKGDKVYVEGKLKKRSWQDKEGNTRYATEVVGDDLTILTRSDQAERNNAPYSQEGKPANPSPMSGLENNIEDSLPF